MNFLNNRNFLLHKIVTIVLLFTIIISCGTHRKIEENAPEWSKNRPKTDYYYIGIAKVDKAVHPTDYRETAKKMALNDLSSEISVKIESNSLLSTSESNNVYNSDYQQYIKTEINKELSGFEMVSDYDSKKTYQVYYRLSKAKWKEIQNQQKVNAANKAFHWYKQAVSEKEKLNYISAIQYYLNALIELKKYWNESVSYQINKKKVQIDQLIKTELLEILSDIHIQTDCQDIILDTKNDFSKDIKISVVNSKGSFLKNLPLLVSYKKSSIPYQSVFLSLAEVSTVRIEDVDLKKTSNYFTVELEKDKILKIAPENRRMLHFIYDAFNVKSVKIPIKINLPNVYISLSSDDKFTVQSFHYLKDGISSALNREGVNMVDNLENSDLNLIISIHETKGSNTQRFKQQFLSYNIVVKNNHTQKIIYTQDYPQTKGTDISYEKACEKAYIKAAEEFKFQYAKKLLKGIL